MKFKGIMFTILSALLFGVTPILASKTYDMGSNPETLTFYRNFLVIPIVFIIMLIKKTSFKIDWKTLFNMVLIGCMGRGVTTLTLYMSYDYIGVGTATTLHFLYPVFVALICFFFYKEHLEWTKILALFIAIVGVSFFIDSGHKAAFLGILLSVGSALSYAYYMVGLDKKGLKDIDPFKVSFYMAIAVSSGMLIYNIPTQKINFALPPKAFLYTFIIAVCTSFLAVILLQMGLRYLSATSASILCLFEPVSCTIAGIIFLSEELTVFKAVGTLLILAAVIIIMLSSKLIELTKRKKSSVQE